MIAIFKRELKSYFSSMIGFVFMAVLLIFIGLYFYMYNLYYGYPYFSYALSGTLFIFMLVIPILTMRSFADERHSKTDQLLLTSPLSVGKIVTGKFLSMAAILGGVCLISCLCPLIIMTFGSSYPATDYASILMYFLLGCAYISIGMFLSSLTESQIIAAVSSYAVFILLYLISGMASAVPSTANVSYIGFLVILLLVVSLYYFLTKNIPVSFGFFAVGAVILTLLYLTNASMFENALPTLLANLSLSNAFSETANYSVLSFGAVVTYLSVIFFFCFLTTQSIQKRRWS